ncbi:MAG: hypothetical protein RI967_655 [Planctomycetota bacterium]|jgi:hypothetical protein
MNDPKIDALLSRCAALRRGNELIRDAEMRRRGATEHQILMDGVKLAGLQSSVRETAAFHSRTRDWSRLERIVAIASSIATCAAALGAHAVAYRIFIRSFGP